MKNLHRIIIAAVAVAIVGSTAVKAQNYPVEDRQLYDFFQGIPIDYSVGQKSNAGSAKSGSVRSQRPDHVNNQATNYFPPIFNQSGGSCGSSANVAYMLCYEINTLRNQDGKHNTDYQFPSHFTWLTCSENCPERTMAMRNGIPSVTVYGGQTYSKYFGLQDTEEKDVGWMQGYDKWFSAMHNRARGMGKFKYGLDTPEGFEMAKDWLWNHCGDEDFQTGGVFVIGVAAGPEYTLFPETAANRDAGVIGHHYVTTWGPKYNHALTVVGYDDRVEFDLDSNGVVGEKEKGETGAWIIVNSWGQGWCDGGTIYCPYAYTYCVGLSGSTWDPAFYHPRKNFRPLRTIKLLMDYNRRTEVCLGAGIAQDTSATQPEISTTFAHFNYTGSLKSGSNDIPMLGRWADGYHYEPMELGYDLTDLSENFDRTKPLKYFFFINTKYSAQGKGNIYKASIIDYEFDREGIEIPFRIDTVAILNRGKTTMISVVIPGEQAYKPVNLEIADNKLVWQAPQKSGMTLTGYNIYQSNKQIDQVAADVLSYDLNSEANGAYTVAAVYDYEGQVNVSGMSNAVRKTVSVETKTNSVLELKNSAISIPNGVPRVLQNATIEYWIFPYELYSYNEQLGPGWGTFLCHTTGGGNIYVGWNTGSDRICSTSGLLKENTWTHVAITIKNNVMTLYVNGEKKNSITSSNFSGLPAVESFPIGDNFYKFNGRIDEFRIWSECRTQEEIKANMRNHIANPTAQPTLVTYLNMDLVDDSGDLKVNEYASGNDVSLNDSESWNIITDGSFLTGSTTLSSVDFNLSANNVVKGKSIVATPKLPLAAAKIEWSAPSSQTPSTTITEPTFVYDTPGTYTITLKAYDTDGKIVEASKDVVVEDDKLPVADFEIAVNNVPAGDRISLINRSQGDNCTYVWSMPGAADETLSSTNASAVYVETGMHPVTLTVTNSAGSSKVTKFVTVENTIPAVAFDINPSNVLVGQKVALVDRTKYEPTKWMWTVTNNRHNIGIKGQDYNWEPTAPGVYDVSLTATNNVGTGSLSQKKAIFVSNADPENGLNFVGGGEQVIFKSPVSATTKAFTIDFWLYPTSLAGAANLKSDDGVMSLSTSATGETTLLLNKKSVASGEGYIIASEWHHYAITYKSGTVVFYRDGEKFVQPSSRLALSSPAWTGNITLGSQETPFCGMIDEFKFWSKALTVSELQETCNQPIANPDSMCQNGNLVIYYDFNQSSGNVQCATNSDYIGTRNGFGPDGDAWTSSLGVFTLDFSELATEKDVTSEYLTNYKAPFANSGVSINSTNYITRFLELETGTEKSTWVVENAVSDGKTITGAHVDTYFNSNLTCTAGDMGFANEVNDHRLYQTVVLPAGRYRLTITPHSTVFSSSGSYIVVNEGDTLMGNSSLADALAYAYLDDKELIFDITDEEAEVSLGFIYNLINSRVVAISEITLTQMPYEFINAEDPDAVISIDDSPAEGDYLLVPGGVKCTSDKQLSIVSLDGISMRTGFCTPGAVIKLPKGIYIINNQKVEIK